MSYIDKRTVLSSLKYSMLAATGFFLGNFMYPEVVATKAEDPVDTLALAISSLVGFVVSFVFFVVLLSGVKLLNEKENS